MPSIDRDNCVLLLVDFQARLMPAIEDGAAVVANAKRLIEAARLLQVPAVLTEQNAGGLGTTIPELRPAAAAVVHKMTFDACLAPEFWRALATRPDVVVAGCETHVCVLQTVLGLLQGGRRVHAVRDAMGSRRAESKETAIRRMSRHGADVLTTEMVLFEWLRTAEDSRLRQIIDLIR
ncbi:MAG TPA: isochorismatase family protein [Stellaceae bacterium]|nr:isochorismatase family protein [Stellaceae bacterium]